jgi:hypothetical protein
MHQSSCLHRTTRYNPSSNHHGTDRRQVGLGISSLLASTDKREVGDPNPVNRMARIDRFAAGCNERSSIDDATATKGSGPPSLLVWRCGGPTGHPSGSRQAATDMAEAYVRRNRKRTVHRQGRNYAWANDGTVFALGSGPDPRPHPFFAHKRKCQYYGPEKHKETANVTVGNAGKVYLKRQGRGAVGYAK